jgi:hypothetical protein
MLKKHGYIQCVTCTEEKRNIIRVLVGKFEELGVERNQIGV